MRQIHGLSSLLLPVSVLVSYQNSNFSLFVFLFIRRSSLASWSLKATSSWVRNWRSSWRITPSCELPCQPIRCLQEPTHRTSSVLLLAFWSMRAALHFASRGTFGTVTHWDEQHFKVEFCLINSVSLSTKDSEVSQIEDETGRFCHIAVCDRNKHFRISKV